MIQRTKRPLTHVAFYFSQLQYPEDDEDGQSEEGDGSNSPKPFER